MTVKINHGKQDDFEALAQGMSEATHGESGTPAYEWHLDDAGNTCQIYERYADFDATMTHLGNFGSKYAERFIGLVTPTGVTVYGQPNRQVE